MGKGVFNRQPSTLARGFWEPLWYPGLPPPPGGPPMKEIGPLPTHAAGGQGEGEQVYFLVPEVSLGNPGPTPSP